MLFYQGVYFNTRTLSPLTLAARLSFAFLTLGAGDQLGFASCTQRSDRELELFLYVTFDYRFYKVFRRSRHLSEVSGHLEKSEF